MERAPKGKLQFYLVVHNLIRCNPIKVSPKIDNPLNLICTVSYFLFVIYVVVKLGRGLENQILLLKPTNKLILRQTPHLKTSFGENAYRV